MTFFGLWVVDTTKDLEMRSSWIRLGSKSWGVWRRHCQRGTGWEAGAGNGVARPQVKECQRLLAALESWGQILRDPRRG